ncbi:protein B4-like [Salarias fasciatus]|uniref:Protein B4-like n=1 Tax=Salarias fasciatus TaxID=181472 RepID=A0A672FKA7_SALFA|nr:protein B4-like [Salarias fasciatus]
MLDSGKGVSSQAIQSYIMQTYPSVDPVRLKHLVCNSLKKGLENGTLVRPANSTVPAGATGKFRLGPEANKSKSEDTYPNVKKAPKAAKEKQEPKKGGAVKIKEEAVSEQTTSSKDLSSTKSEDETVPVSKVPAKKPKPKKAADKAADKPSASEKKKVPEKKAAEGVTPLPPKHLGDERRQEN